MSKFPQPEWQLLGSTSNAEFYSVRDDLVVIVPHPDSTDDEKTARESIAFQDQHWKKLGHRGAVVVYMDPVLEQTSGARAVYAEETSDTLSTCYALVGESFFAMAAAAVFEGLSKPGVPTQIFRSLEDALPFVEEMNKAHGSKV